MTQERCATGGILLIGVGNEYRSDDRVGLVVARKLQEMRLPNTKVIEESGEGTALMERWRDAEAVILFDAAACGGVPGKIHRFDASAGTIPAKSLYHSTHAFSVVEAVELARVMNELPPRFIIYAVEGESFAAGSNVSEQVEAAVGEVVKRALADYRHLTCRRE